MAQLDAPTGDQEVAGSTPAASITFFLGDLTIKLSSICMKCQNLFSGKNKKKYFRMLRAEILPTVLIVKATFNNVYKPEKAS